MRSLERECPTSRASSSSGRSVGRPVASVFVALVACAGGDKPADRPDDTQPVDSGCETVVVSWPDQDGDGYGAAMGEVGGCDVPDGYVLDATDCDDASAEVHPGATERCDGEVDEDCEGQKACPSVDVLASTDRLVGQGHGDSIGSAVVSLDARLFVASARDSSAVYGWEGGGDGTRSIEDAAWKVTNPLPGYGFPSGIAPLRDGGVAVGAPGTGDSRVYLYEWGAETPYLSCETESGGQGVTTADLTGDGVEDVAFDGVYYEPEGYVGIVDGSRTGLVSAGSEDARIEDDQRSQFGRKSRALGDTDGDGFSDLAVDGVGVYVFSGPLSGVMRTEDANVTILDDGDHDAARIGAPGDVDGDGRADLLAAFDAEALLLFTLGTNTAQSSADAVATLNCDGTPDPGCLDPLAGGFDQDADGRDDILVGWGVTGDDYSFGAWLAYGPFEGAVLSSETGRILDSDGEWLSAGAAADLDLDGELEIYLGLGYWSGVENWAGAVFSLSVP